MSLQKTTRVYESRREVTECAVFASQSPKNQNRETKRQVYWLMLHPTMSLPVQSPKTMSSIVQWILSSSTLQLRGQLRPLPDSLLSLEKTPFASYVLYLVSIYSISH